jgi:hypothetical protein
MRTILYWLIFAPIWPANEIITHIKTIEGHLVAAWFTALQINRCPNGQFDESNRELPFQSRMSFSVSILTRNHIEIAKIVIKEYHE